MTTTKIRIGVRQARRLRGAAASIRSNPYNYDQGTFGPLDHGTVLGECGTAACVAGWLVHNEGHRQRSGIDVSQVAERLVGATAVVRFVDVPALFDGSWRPKGWRWSMGKRATANHVATALEGLASGKQMFEVSLTYDQVDHQFELEARA